MLDDCEAGKIDIVLTKSISRFARNTVDLLSTVRHLRELGIEVRFEKERINSLSGDGELMLSILASFAQEESRSISENTKWGLRKRYQSGKIGVVNKHVLGYRYDEGQRKYVIIPEEAEIVRLMFYMYLKQVPLKKISKALNEAGYRPVSGKNFCSGTVDRMIKNEIYAGNLVCQKNFVKDPIAKSKVKNYGQLPKYRIEGCHEAIIDPETYALVREEMERRTKLVEKQFGGRKNG